MKIERPWEYINREYLVKNGFSSSQACAKMGLNPSTLYRIRNGIRGITPIVAKVMEEEGIASADFLLDMQDRWNEYLGKPPVDRNLNKVRHFKSKPLKNRIIQDEKDLSSVKKNIDKNIVKNVIASLKKVDEKTMLRRMQKKTAPVRVVGNVNKEVKPLTPWRVLKQDVLIPEKGKNKNAYLRLKCHYMYEDDDTVLIKVKNDGQKIDNHVLTVALGKTFDRGLRVDFRYE